jgi:hypothetical protein
VSPKEIFAAVDTAYIAIANIAPPISVRNPKYNAQGCVSFIDAVVQKGYMVMGLACDAGRQAADFSHWVEPMKAMAGPRFPIHNEILG